MPRSSHRSKFDEEDGLGAPPSLSPTYTSSHRCLPRDCRCSNIVFYLLIFSLGYCVALFPQFRLLENGQFMTLSATHEPPSHEHALENGPNEHIRAAVLDDQNKLGQKGGKKQSAKKKWIDSLNLNLSESIPTGMEQHALFADWSYDPPLFYSDGVGLGRPSSERLADQNNVIHQTPPLTRHSWQLAPIPSFLLEGCPTPINLKDLPIPSPDGTAHQRPDILAYFPKYSPKEVMKKGWGDKHPISWEAQRALFDTIHHPLSPGAVKHNSNGNNWHKLDSLQYNKKQEIHKMEWDQYVPMVMHFQEMQDGKRKCRGSTGFELRLDCYDSSTLEPAESYTYRTRPHILDHGNGVYSVRILLEKPGYCQFEMFLHETVDHEGVGKVHAPSFQPHLSSLKDYLQSPYFRADIHVSPAQISKKFQEFAASPKGRTTVAKYMHSIPSKALSPPILDGLRLPLSSYEAQLALALRMRRRRECNVDDYTLMTAWTGAWYKLHPREQTPCIRRREQDPYQHEQRNPEEDEKWEISQMSVSGTDIHLGPLCSMDTYDGLEWHWPGDNPATEPQWIYSREECYTHVFSPRSLWQHWHDQRLMFNMDSNGQDLIRVMARSVFDLRKDVIPDVLERDIMLKDLSPLKTNMNPALAEDLIRMCKQQDDDIDSAFKNECSLSISNKFFDYDGYANHIGLAVWEHRGWVQQLTSRINEDNIPIGAFLINNGLHDRDFIRHGHLSPWRSGVKRRPSWRVHRTTSVITHSTNTSFRFQDTSYPIDGDRANFDATELNKMEIVDQTIESTSSWDDLDDVSAAYLQSNINPSSPGAATLFLANHINSTQYSGDDTTEFFGPPSSHLAFKVDGVLSKLENLLQPFRKSNYEKAAHLTTHSIRQALRRKLEKEPNYRAPSGSVAATEQARMSNDHSASKDLASTLPLGPIYLWRSAPCPAGFARDRESSTTTIHIINSETRSVLQQKSFHTRAWHRRFVDGAFATNSDEKPKTLPFCDDLRRDSMSWIGIDVYSISYPWHWSDSFGDGPHYGRNNCFDCQNCGRCLKTNFVEQWAIFAQMHALTLYKELQLQHAFNPHSTFTTTRCRSH